MINLEYNKWQNSTAPVIKFYLSVLLHIHYMHRACRIIAIIEMHTWMFTFQHIILSYIISINQCIQCESVSFHNSIVKMYTCLVFFCCFWCYYSQTIINVAPGVYEKVVDLLHQLPQMLSSPPHCTSPH